MVAGSLNLNDITLQQDTIPNIVLQPLPFLILLIAIAGRALAPPFDIPIGESELVGGPWVEYCGIRWSIIFALTEYAGHVGHVASSARWSSSAAGSSPSARRASGATSTSSTSWCWCSSSRSCSS